jgi:hypothetical protein
MTKNIFQKYLENQSIIKSHKYFFSKIKKKNKN